MPLSIFGSIFESMPRSVLENILEGILGVYLEFTWEDLESLHGSVCHYRLGVCNQEQL